MSNSIDLNCDMGESFGAWQMGDDADVMPWITSANVACGFHAGDFTTMQKTVALAKKHKLNRHVKGLLAAQRRQSCLDQASQERQAGRLRALRRATRQERIAERRLIQAWRRAADVRARLEFPG